MNMDVNENLRQMVTGRPAATAPDMPARGSRIIDPADGAEVIVSRSMRLPNGRLLVIALDDAGDVREVRP